MARRSYTWKITVQAPQRAPWTLTVVAGGLDEAIALAAEGWSADAELPPVIKAVRCEEVIVR